jgi:hypothetical protein
MRTALEPPACARVRRLPVGAAVAVTFLFALAGCAGGGSGIVYNSFFTIAYDPFSVRTVMSRAPLLVESYGSPAAGLTAETVSQATVQSLRQHGAPWFPRSYTASAPDAGNGPYHLRIAYGVPTAFDRQRLCSSAMGPAVLEKARGQDDDASSRALASFCRGETTLGTAEGAPASGAQVGSAAFSEFVGLLGRAVMPRQNPERDDDCLFGGCD